jgi:hypothetical protein
VRFRGVDHFFDWGDAHGKFSSIRKLPVEAMALVRIQFLVAIKPERQRRSNWTMVSIDILVSVGAKNAVRWIQTSNDKELWIAENSLFSVLGNFLKITTLANAPSAFKGRNA